MPSSESSACSTTGASARAADRGNAPPRRRRAGAALHRGHAFDERAALVLDADERHFAGECARGDRGDVADGVAHADRLVGHQRSQRVDHLEFVGKELVGGHGVGLIDRRGREPDEVGVTHLERPAGAEDDDVALPDGHGGGAARVIRPGDVAIAAAVDANDGADAPGSADEQIVRVVEVHDAGPAVATSDAAHQREAVVAVLEHEHIVDVERAGRVESGARESGTARARGGRGGLHIGHHPEARARCVSEPCTESHL